MRLALLAQVAATAAIVAACATAPPSPERTLAPDEVPVFETVTGERVTVDAVLDAIAAADVVVLGEQHGHPTGLRFNAALFERSLARDARGSLCLEFLTRDAQYLVDAYAEGVIDWEALDEACQGIPGCRPGPHRPMIEAALGAGVPVVAANAPRIYTSAARQRGYELLTSLSAEQQRLFDTPWQMPSGAYREAFFARMRRHDEQREGEAAADDDERLEGLYRAQCLWDMTMATSVARCLDRGAAPVFLVVGSFHCNADGGTVQMIRRLRARAKVLVVTFVPRDAQALAEEDRDLADFVAYVGPSPEAR